MNPTLSKYLLYYPATLLRGELIAKYLKVYNQFQWQSQEFIADYSRRRTLALINFASVNSSYYEDVLSGCNHSELESLPFLTKEELINEVARIRTHTSKWASIKTTGGSTGQPVRIYKNPDALARERAATWRAYNWAGVGIGDKQIRFWGVPHGADDALKARLIDYVSNRMRVSAFNLSEEYLGIYHGRILKFKPKYLYGYVSVILALSRYVKDKNLPLPGSLVSVITTSEILTEATRKEIESAWGVKVFNEYGCGEVGSIAHECEHGQLHVMADNLKLEIIDSSGSPAETGEVVVTDYFNFETPLIRYRLGDYATISYEPCACGRTLPTLKDIHGRAYDIITTPSGRSIHPESVIYIFEEIQNKTSAFTQFQVVQTKVDTLDIYLVIRSENYQEHVLREIEQRVRKSIDPAMVCNFYFDKSISREASGKMRVVKSAIE